MAVTFSVPELAGALRLNDSAEETAEVTRLLAYVSVAVVKHAPDAPDTVHDEAARRLAGFLFDMPEAGRYDGYANAMRGSGAGRILLPYKTHRLGLADAIEAAQAAVGTTGNPVTGLDIVGEELVIVFADGTTESLTLPAGMGGGTDQTARDSAATAQTDVDTHKVSTHNTDATARAAAGAVATNLEQALIGLSISTNVLSASRQGGGTAASVIIPTGTGVADGVITSAAINVGAESVTVTTSTGATVVWDLTAILDVVRLLITANQTAINAHGSSTHNHDATARRDAVGAENAITNHIASHPSGLPTGSSQRRELKWDANTSAWLAVSDVTTVYYGAVASGDYLHAAAALAAGLNTAGTRIATDSYLLYKGFNASPLRDDHMMALWAGISQAPSVFVLAPGHTGWINNFTCTVRSGALALIVAEDFVYINGTAYDVAMAIHPGVEADVGSVQFRYTTPAEVYVISQTAA